jgi:hypothetical protein
MRRPNAPGRPALARRPPKFDYGSANDPERIANMAATELVGVVIGGVLGLAGSFIPQWWDKRRARQSAQAICRAYIAGILKMDEIRHHGELYEKNLADLRSGATQSMMRIYGAENNKDEMQSALIGQVGLLSPDVAMDMVIFCNMLDGLRVDLKAMGAGEMDNIPVSDKIRILESDLKIWDDTKALGRNLINRFG